MSPETIFVQPNDSALLNEVVPRVAIRKKAKDVIDAEYVILYDPNTGKPLGASDFFPAFLPLSFTQAGAVQNTWYTAFSGTNVSFNALGIGITVANETVEAQVTVDGTIIAVAAGAALLFGSNKFTSVLANALVLTTGVPVITLGTPAATLVAPQVPDSWLKGRAVKIEVRKTTAGGASALEVFGVYHQ